MGSSRAKQHEIHASAPLRFWILISNDKFCNHAHLRLKHGVQGNPVPPVDLHLRFMAAVKARKNNTLLWYSRDHMWTLVKNMNDVDSVGDLSDEQYMDVLHEANRYFMLKVAQSTLCPLTELCICPMKNRKRCCVQSREEKSLRKHGWRKSPVPMGKLKGKALAKRASSTHGVGSCCMVGQGCITFFTRDFMLFKNILTFSFFEQSPCLCKC